MDAARQALRVAIEAGDVDGQVKAQEQMAKLANDASRLGALKTISERKKEEVVEQLTAAEEAIEEPTAEVEETPETSDATTTEEPTAEVEERIRLEFPHKFDKIDGNSTERVKPTQNVASAKRSSNTGRRKTVKLTPSQVAIAKRLGVPLEEYAKQVNITEGV